MSNETEQSEGAKTHEQPTKPTTEHEIMTDKPHTELVRLESEDPKTHALLCALTDGLRVMKRRAEHSGQHDDHWTEYVDYLEEWQTVVSDAYFHDRRAADPTVENVKADD